MCLRVRVCELGTFPPASALTVQAPGQPLMSTGWRSNCPGTSHRSPAKRLLHSGPRKALHGVVHAPEPWAWASDARRAAL